MTMKSTKVKESSNSFNPSFATQWVLVQAVIDHLGQDVHASSPITERIMDLDGLKMQGTMGSAGPLSMF
jgi:hypothetical protein